MLADQSDSGNQLRRMAHALNVAAQNGDLDTAQSCADSIATMSPDPLLKAFCHFCLAIAHRLNQDTTAAMNHLGESLTALAERHGPLLIRVQEMRDNL